jgi:hypothetical protein
MQDSTKEVELPPFVSWDECHQQIEEMDAEMDRFFIHEGNTLFLNYGRYPIELRRIPSKAALIEWIHHLSGKGWMVPKQEDSELHIVREFIKRVCKIKGWKIYGFDKH